MAEKQREGTVCVSCERPVRSGMKCVQMFCPYVKDTNRDGVPVVARPVRVRWIF